MDWLLICVVMKFMGLFAGNKVDLWGLWPGAWLWHSNCGWWSCNWGPKDRLSCVSTFVSGTFVLDTLLLSFLFLSLMFSSFNPHIIYSSSSSSFSSCSVSPSFISPLSNSGWEKYPALKCQSLSLSVLQEDHGNRKKNNNKKERKTLLHIDAHNAVCLTRCSGMFLRVLLLIVLKFMVFIKFYWCCFMCALWQSLESARAVTEHYGIPGYSLSLSHSLILSGCSKPQMA